jgi:hypothetical protein
LSSEALALKVLNAVSFFSSLFGFFIFLPSSVSVSLQVFVHPLWGFWSSRPLIGLIELAGIMTELSSCCWSCDRNSVCWLMFNINSSLPISRSWWSHWGCYGRWSMPYMLILNVPEHEYDFCCSNYSVIFLVLFCFYFDVGFPLFLLADWLLLCCQIWNIDNLNGSSKNSFQCNFQYL